MTKHRGELKGIVVPKKWYCDVCGKTYSPNKLSPEERLLQALFGEHVCPSCLEHRSAKICAKCNKLVLKPVYFEDEPYHPKCLAEVFGL